MTQAATLYVDLLLRKQQYDSGMQQAWQSARKMQSAAIAPQVDAKELHGLNKLYDKKIAHHKEVGRFVAANPITPTYDGRNIVAGINQLRDYKDELAAVKSQVGSMGANVGTTINQRVVVDFSRFDYRMAYEIRSLHNDISKDFGKVVDAIVGLKPSLVERVASFAFKTVTAPVRMAAGVAGQAVGNVFTGYTEDIGRTLFGGMGRRQTVDFSNQVKRFARILDEEVVGRDKAYATFFAEFFRSGSIDKAFSRAIPRSEAGKIYDRLMKLQEIVTQSTPKASIAKINKDPELKEIFKQSGGDFRTFLENAQPTNLTEKIVNPIIKDFQPLLRFIQDIRAARTAMESQKFYNERKAAFPKLDNYETIVNVSGGAQFKGGQGGRSVAMGLEMLAPNAYFMPVENPESDVTPGKEPDIEVWIKKNIFDKIPGISADFANTAINLFRQVNTTLNPFGFSTAAAQGIANTRLAQEQGKQGSFTSFSLGGVDALSYARTQEYLGLNSNSLAMNYPYLNMLGQKPKGFNSAIVAQDPLTFPMIMGFGSPEGIYNQGGKGVIGTQAHHYKHLFKDDAFNEKFYQTIGVNRPDLSPTDRGALIEVGEKLYEIMGAAEQFDSLTKTGKPNASSPFNTFMATNTGTNVSYEMMLSKFFEWEPIVKKLKSANGSNSAINQIYDELTAYFVDIQERVVSQLAQFGFSPPDMSNLAGYQKFQSDVGSQMKYIGEMRQGVSDERFQKFKEWQSTNISTSIPWFNHSTQRKTYGDVYVDGIIKAYKAFNATVDEYARTAGKISDEFIQSLDFPEYVPIPSNVRRMFNYQFDTSILPKEEVARIEQLDVPKPFKQKQSAILAFNQLQKAIPQTLPNINQIQGIGLGMSGAVSLLGQDLVYKTDLDPEGLSKVASPNEVKAYEKLQGRLSPLLYQSVPGQALVTERIQGRPLKDILDRIAKPIKELQEKQAKLREAIAKSEDPQEIQRLGRELDAVREKAKTETTRFNKAANILYKQVGQLGAALQKMGVVHNDLASGNVFFAQGGPVAIDLGNSQVIQPGQTTLTPQQKFNDFATSIQRSVIDRDYFGILNPLSAAGAIVSGYQKPLPIPQPRQVDPSLLTPAEVAQPIPLGTTLPSLLYRTIARPVYPPPNPVAYSKPVTIPIMGDAIANPPQQQRPVQIPIEDGDITINTDSLERTIESTWGDGLNALVVSADERNSLIKQLLAEQKRTNNLLSGKKNDGGDDRGGNQPLAIPPRRGPGDGGTQAIVVGGGPDGGGGNSPAGVTAGLAINLPDAKGLAQGLNITAWSSADAVRRYVAEMLKLEKAIVSKLPWGEKGLALLKASVGGLAIAGGMAEVGLLSDYIQLVQGVFVDVFDKIGGESIDVLVQNIGNDADAIIQAVRNIADTALGGDVTGPLAGIRGKINETELKIIQNFLDLASDASGQATELVDVTLRGVAGALTQIGGQAAGFGAAYLGLGAAGAVAGNLLNEGVKAAEVNPLIAPISSTWDDQPTPAVEGKTTPQLTTTRIVGSVNDELKQIDKDLRKVLDPRSVIDAEGRILAPLNPVARVGEIQQFRRDTDAIVKNPSDITPEQYVTLLSRNQQGRLDVGLMNAKMQDEPQYIPLNSLMPQIEQGKFGDARQVVRSLASALEADLKNLLGVTKKGSDIKAKLVAWSNEVGIALPEGLLAGIKKGDLKKDELQSVAAEVIDVFKKAFKISSPSKVFEAIGQQIVAGLANGLTGLEGTLVEKKALLESYVKSLNKTSLETGIAGGTFISSNKGAGSLTGEVSTESNKILLNILAGIKQLAQLLVKVNLPSWADKSKIVDSFGIKGFAANFMDEGKVSKVYGDNSTIYKISKRPEGESDAPHEAYALGKVKGLAPNLIGYKNGVLATERLEGQTFRSLIESGGIDVDQAKDYISQAGSLFEQVQQRGVAHQDYHLGNIFAETSGKLKAIDFGISYVDAPNKELTKNLEKQLKHFTENFEWLAKKAPGELKQISGNQVQRLFLEGVAKARGVSLDEVFKGLSKEVQQRLGLVKESGKDIGDAVSSGTKSALKIQSPSKVFEAIGRDVVLGLKQGLSIDSIVSSIPKEIKELIGNIKGVIEKESIFLPIVVDKENYMANALMKEARKNLEPIEYIGHRTRLSNAESIITDGQIYGATNNQFSNTVFGEIAQTNKENQRAIPYGLIQFAIDPARVKNRTTVSDGDSERLDQGGSLITMPYRPGLSKGSSSPYMETQTSGQIGIEDLIGINLGDSARVINQYGDRLTGLLKKAVAAGVPIFANDSVLLGKMLGKGMAQGIYSIADLPIIAATTNAKDLIEAVKKVYGIASPSRVFFRIGQYVIQGFNNGLTADEIAPQLRGEIARIIQDVQEDLWRELERPRRANESQSAFEQSQNATRQTLNQVNAMGADLGNFDLPDLSKLLGGLKVIFDNVGSTVGEQMELMGQAFAQLHSANLSGVNPGDLRTQVVSQMVDLLGGRGRFISAGPLPPINAPINRAGQFLGANASRFTTIPNLQGIEPFARQSQQASDAITNSGNILSDAISSVASEINQVSSELTGDITADWQGVTPSGLSSSFNSSVTGNLPTTIPFTGGFQNIPSSPISSVTGRMSPPSGFVAPPPTSPAGVTPPGITPPPGTNFFANLPVMRAPSIGAPTSDPPDKRRIMERAVDWARNRVAEIPEDNITRVLRSINDVLDNIESGAEEAGIGVRGLGRIIGDLEEKHPGLARIVSTIKDVGIGVLFAMGLAQVDQLIVDFGRSSIDAALKVERFKVALSYNTSGGIAGLQRIRDLSSEIGANFLTTAENYSKMTVAAAGTNIAPQVENITVGFTKALTAQGATPEEQGRAFLAIQQMIGKNQIMAEELRQQLAEVMPQVTGALARSKGMTSQQLVREMKNSALLPEEDLLPLAKQLEVESTIPLATFRSGPLPKIANIQNQFQQVQAGFGEGILKFPFALDVANAAVTGLAKSVEFLSWTITAAVGIFGGRALLGLLAFGSGTRIVTVLLKAMGLQVLTNNFLLDAWNYNLGGKMPIAAQGAKAAILGVGSALMTTVAAIAPFAALAGISLVAKKAFDSWNTELRQVAREARKTADELRALADIEVNKNPVTGESPGQTEQQKENLRRKELGLPPGFDFSRPLWGFLDDIDEQGNRVNTFDRTKQLFNRQVSPELISASQDTRSAAAILMSPERMKILNSDLRKNQIAQLGIQAQISNVALTDPTGIKYDELQKQSAQLSEERMRITEKYGINSAALEAQIKTLEQDREYILKNDMADPNSGARLDAISTEMGLVKALLATINDSAAGINANTRMIDAKMRNNEMLSMDARANNEIINMQARVETGKKYLAGDIDSIQYGLIQKRLAEGEATNNSRIAFTEMSNAKDNFSSMEGFTDQAKALFSRNDMGINLANYGGDVAKAFLSMSPEKLEQLIQDGGGLSAKFLQNAKKYIESTRRFLQAQESEISARNEMARAQEEVLKRLRDSQRTIRSANTSTRNIALFNAGKIGEPELQLREADKARQEARQALADALKDQQAFGADPVQTREAVVQANRAVAEAERNFITSQRSLESGLRSQAIAIEDYNQSVFDNQLQFARQVRDTQWEVEDAYRNMVRQTRDLKESWTDLVFGLDTKLLEAQLELQNTRDNLEKTRRRITVEQTSPFSENYGRKAATIVADYLDALDGNESEARNLQKEQRAIGEEYVTTLRSIRGEVEKQLDAEVERNRTLIRLNERYMDLVIAVDKAVRDIDRRAKELGRSIERDFPGFKGALNTFTAPQLPNSPAGVPGYVSQGGQAINKQGYAIVYQNGTTQVVNQPQYPQGYGVGGLLPQEMALPTAVPFYQQQESYYGSGGFAREPQQLVQQRFDPSNYERGDVNILSDYQKANLNGGYVEPVVNVAPQPVQQQWRSPVAQPQLQAQPRLQAQPSSQSLEIQSFEPLLRLIRSGEGGYGSFNRGRAGDSRGQTLQSLFNKPLEKITVNEIIARQGKGQLFAVGAYQFIPSTLQSAARRTGLGNAAFTPETQHLLAIDLIKNKRPQLGNFVLSSGRNGSLQEAIQASAREWASIGLAYPEAGRRAGQSRYSGIGGNRASISPDRAGEAINETIQRRRSLGLQSSLNFGIPESIELAQTAQANNGYTPNSNTQADNPEARVLPSGTATGLGATYKFLVENAGANIWQLDRMEYGAKHGMQTGALTGGVLGLPFGPAGVGIMGTLGGLSGAAIGAAVEGSNAEIPELGQWAEQWTKTIKELPPPPTPAGAVTNETTKVPQADPRRQVQGANTSPFNLPTIDPNATFDTSGVEQFTSQVLQQNKPLPVITGNGAPVVADVAPIRPVSRMEAQQAADRAAEAAQLRLLRLEIERERLAKNRQLEELKFLNNIINLTYEMETQRINLSRRDVADKFRIQELRMDSKGFTTDAESIIKIGMEVEKQFIDIRNANDDMQRDLGRQIGNSQSELARLNEIVATGMNDDGRKLSAVELENVNTAIATVTSRIEDLGILKKTLNDNTQAMLGFEEATKRSRMELERLNKITAGQQAYADILGTFFQARYDVGATNDFGLGTLINKAPIAKAEMDKVLNAKKLDELRRQGILTGESFAKVVEMQKEIDQLNLDRAFVQAIPGLEAFSSELRSVILESANLGEAARKMGNVVLGIIADQLAIKPLQNWIAKTIGPLLGFDDPSLKPVTTTLGSGFAFAKKVAETANNIVPFSLAGVTGEVGSDVLSPYTAASDAILGLADSATASTGILGEVLNVAGVTQQSAAITFANSLAIATQSVVAFTAALNARSGGSLVSSVTTGGGGLLGGLLKAGQFAASAVLPAFGAANAASAFIPSSGYTGATVSLPGFAEGGFVGNAPEIPTMFFGGGMSNFLSTVGRWFINSGLSRYANRPGIFGTPSDDYPRNPLDPSFDSGVANAANPAYLLQNSIAKAFIKERAMSGGRQPILAVLNTDEYVVSAKEAKDYLQWLSIKKSGTKTIPNFAEGGPVADAMKRERIQSGGKQPILSVINANEYVVPANEATEYLSYRNWKNIKSNDVQVKNFAMGGFGDGRKLTVNTTTSTSGGSTNNFYNNTTITVQNPNDIGLSAKQIERQRKLMAERNML